MFILVQVVSYLPRQISVYVEQIIVWGVWLQSFGKLLIVLKSFPLSFATASYQSATSRHNFPSHILTFAQRFRCKVGVDKLSWLWANFIQEIEGRPSPEWHRLKNKFRHYYCSIDLKRQDFYIVIQCFPTRVTWTPRGTQGLVRSYLD